MAYLLERGVDIEARDSSSKTSLHYALILNDSHTMSDIMSEQENKQKNAVELTYLPPTRFWNSNAGQSSSFW